jgi:glycosyltransferase involved in cell wall biosynthesis
MSGDPPLSVVMPVHDCVAYVEESVRSILGQSFRDYELVIGDDGSDDGTTEVLDRLASEDSRIRLLRRERRSGLAASAAWVISHSRAPLVAIAHGDDISHPHRLRRQVELFDAAPDASLVGAMAMGIDARGGVAHPPNLWRLVRPSVFAPFAHSAAMFRRVHYDQVGGYRAQAEYWEDLDLFWRLYEIGRILVIPEALTSYRYSRVSVRVRGNVDRVEHSLDVMYRSTALYRAHRDYDGLFHEAAAERIHPRIFVARSWTRVWCGQRSDLLGRMFRKADLKLDLPTLQTLVFVTWASLSPRTLRLVLQMVTRARNAIARRVLAGAAYVEWTPRRLVRREITESALPGSADGGMRLSQAATPPHGAGATRRYQPDQSLEAGRTWHAERS